MPLRAKLQKKVNRQIACYPNASHIRLMHIKLLCGFIADFLLKYRWVEKVKMFLRCDKKAHEGKDESDFAANDDEERVFNADNEANLAKISLLKIPALSPCSVNATKNKVPHCPSRQ
ncbi:hypothetical protein scyTo_0009261 [Scyliorhinus torazame]|uniref:Uncharacterized protein n=1 Tax=Scyliorhinus torazame TaxID=75743 RepID=A0A401NJE8_SCYTO|nr:hypothetical protein [Scyliorhinus torazame]